MTSRRNRVLLYLSTAQRKRMSHGTGYDLLVIKTQVYTTAGLIILCEKTGRYTWFRFFLFSKVFFIFDRVACVLPCSLRIPVQKQFNVLALHQTIALDWRPVVFFQAHQHLFVLRQTVQSFQIANF